MRVQARALIGPITDPAIQALICLIFWLGYLGVWLGFGRLTTLPLAIMSTPMSVVSSFSFGDARGINSLLCVCWLVVKDVAIAGCTSICFELCCLIDGEFFFQPTQLGDVR